MIDTAIIFSSELGRLVDDYYKCKDQEIKEQIQMDIQLLSDAIVLCEESR